MGQAVIGLSQTQITASTSVPQFRLGTVGGYDDPTNGYEEFVYGKAGTGGATGAGYLCVESTGFVFTMATTTNTAAGTYGHGSRCGAAQAAMSANDYGWFQILGKGSLRTAGAAAIGTRLNTTATAGAVDDDGTAGARAINGIVLLTATAGAATGTDAVFSYPTVGATL